MSDTFVKKVRLGDFVEISDEVNTEGIAYPVMGLNKEKSFMPTVAKLDSVNLKKYKTVRPGDFAYSGMQTGRDECIRLARYKGAAPALVSPAYTTFRIRPAANGSILLPDYLMLLFSRSEADRYGAFISDSSVRANLDWPRFLNIRIPLPEPALQQKLTEVWTGLGNIVENNSAQSHPLTALCMSILRQLRADYPSRCIGPYLEPYDVRNSASHYSLEHLRGIGTDKRFIPTKANMDGVSLRSYKLVCPRSFAFVADTSRRGDKMSLAYNTSAETYLVSSISTVFHICDETKLCPEYLYLWYLRAEFDRYARFHSWGSARETFSFEDMQRVAIPIPPIETQHAVVDLYKCARECRTIAETAAELKKTITPALVQYAAHI